jgi:Glu-tRNA(Gln) amidotransferase subunit E-like FAD-binding protein
VSAGGTDGRGFRLLGADEVDDTVRKEILGELEPQTVADVISRLKHHAANQIAVRADEIAEYLRKGYLLRMRGEVSGQVNLISPAEIKREVF